MYRSIVAALCLCACSSPPRAVSSPAATVEEGFVTTGDGARLYYRKLGRGPAVAIVPGAAFYGAELDRLAARHTIIAYDMRNRGRSSRTAQISIRHDVEDLERVRAHFGIAKVVPIGWSYLGMMVMLYAIEHPDRVDRVIQIGPIARVFGSKFPPELSAKDDPAWSQATANAEIQKLAASDLAPEAHCRAFWAVFRGSLVGDQRNAARVPDPCAHETEWPRNLDPHFQALFTSIATAEPPSWERFASLRVPVLTIHGTQDRQSPYGAGREWAGHLADARLLTVPGAAHMVWLDEPELTLDAIDVFLAGSWPKPAATAK